MEASLMQTIAEKDKSDLQLRYAEAQNAFLKQQINPHLLFNTLNTIYSAVYVNAPTESEAVLLLSEIMRYSYEEPDGQGLVPLEKELSQLKNLIHLNSYRFSSNVQLDYRIKGNPQNYKIIPLVLITLTENMFKHGDLRMIPRSVEITISENGHLTFVGKNVPKVPGKEEPTTSIGLINTRLRLDYAYKDNYQLDISHTNDLFTLELTINLAYERSNY
ncbi:LytS/YehU family sensor histidine kinase [Mucilaginibacter sp. SG538B]|uniref:sensor histidine kinase n=1 Tax=Mucilaginibacter sp. SG538B TaxID=2587021 RepID=UPI00159E0AF0|nr:histidine kinase [Mucilaginibacter sp. SG538B]NVM66900.1 LytS/YehU family sensor histidine kinase [Mucilaginibacter sp. SG538B]